MIEPFESGQVRESAEGRIISYGTSSYGYDVRCANEFKIFTNINSAIVDPKNFDDESFVDIQSDVCIIPPNAQFVCAGADRGIFSHSAQRIDDLPR
jgi:dCTP deaminase